MDYAWHGRADPATGRRRGEWEDVVTSTAPDADDRKGPALKLGISAGLVVQEMGYDDDCDDDLRESVVLASGSELVDEDYDDVVDVVLLWWREDDGDLVDALVDAIAILADQGVVWLLTPKPGRDGHVESAEISDAAPTAGLQSTSTVSASREWQGTRLVAPRARR
jgi:hypothetical protein